MEINLIKYIKATPTEVREVVYKIMQEDLVETENLLHALYERGYKIVRLEDGE